MKKLEFKIKIAAPPETVWETMLDRENFKEWTGVSWPGSFYKGTWGKDEVLQFVSNDGGGTQARIIEFKPYEYMLAEHIAVVNSDGSLDTKSEQAKGWIGSLEGYRFKPDKNGTELIVQISTTKEWEKMFSDGWPNALKKVKELSEAKVPHSVES